MKLYLALNGNAAAGRAAALVAEDLGIALVPETEADVRVSVGVVPENRLSVSLDGKDARIEYGGGTARFLRALATLAAWVRSGETKKSVTEAPIFTTNGPMIDCSRNAVMNVKTVRFMLRRIALMGMNMFMLYTEDTYEVPERPYFGYMRGRYTRDELREIDRYAAELGIEVIPCIQMLGHLATALRWGAAGRYKDAESVLLVGAEETYAFLDDLLRTISETFTSKRIHIGMDETHSLGTGRSLDLNGYRERNELYFEHLKRVCGLLAKYGFKPMMWSDMIFRLAGKGLKGYGDYDVRVELTEEYRRLFPQSVQPVFWDYYHPDENFYTANIDKHALISDRTVFAGGVWCWSGHCTLFSRSRRNTVPALDACRKKGIREVISTVWHNGSEAQLVFSLAGLAWYADYDYTGRFDEDSVRRCFAAAVGQDYDTFLRTEEPEFLAGSEFPVTRALLYNDPLTGLLDRHLEGIDCGAYYRALSASFAALGEGTGEFAPAFDVIRKLTSLLENKADFGLRLKAAYDAGDRALLASLAGECDTIVEKLRALTDAHRTAWMEYNKPFGWEIHDIRYGGLIARFTTAKVRITAYLNGDTGALAELSVPRLRFDNASPDAAHFTGSFLWHRYSQLATANIL